MENVQVQYTQDTNDFGRTNQVMYLTDNGIQTRDYYWTLENARNQLDQFNFENGKIYHIKYLTSSSWKVGSAFQKVAHLNPADYAYSIEEEDNHYGISALERDDIHVYGIVVEELSP